jgi:hypothetical protein
MENTVLTMLGVLEAKSQREQLKEQSRFNITASA